MGQIGKQADDLSAQDGWEKKIEKEEERNERRARQWLQMGWYWQWERDGSLERRRESAAGRLLTASLLGEGLLMTAYSFMISLPDSRQVCLLRCCSCIITFWPCHCSASVRPRRWTQRGWYHGGSVGDKGKRERQIWVGSVAVESEGLQTRMQLGVVEDGAQDLHLVDVCVWSERKHEWCWEALDSAHNLSWVRLRCCFFLFILVSYFLFTVD